MSFEKKFIILCRTALQPEFFTYYIKRFCFILKLKIANFYTQDMAVEDAHACRISAPRQGEIDIRYGVGADCISCGRRLAMPQFRYTVEYRPTLFVYPKPNSKNSFPRDEACFFYQHHE